MNTIVRGLIALGVASMMMGCSLMWGVDPKERPLSEVDLCTNGLDDDQDRMSDCDDPDCDLAN